jgi:hypothetical protein
MLPDFANLVFSEERTFYELIHISHSNGCHNGTEEEVYGYSAWFA